MRLSMVIVCASMVLAACGVAPTAAPVASDTEPATLLSERVPNPRAFGDPKAPIVMREFSDYQ
ncbi:MAG: hypothetical protein RLZZ297_1777 [Chloroflexota bacterium]|jgi:hypothetical protein